MTWRLCLFAGVAAWVLLVFVLCMSVCDWSDWEDK